MSLECIDFSTVDFDSWFEDVFGKQLVNVITIGKFFGKSKEDCVASIRRNIKLYKGQFFEYEFQKPQLSDSQPEKINRGRKPKSYYLTRDGCLTFADNLNYNEYDGDREKFIVSFKRAIIKTAGKVIDGELVQVDTPPVIEKIKEKRHEGTHLNKQVARCVKDWLMPDYARKGLNPHDAFPDEHRAINTIVNGEHEKDLKNKLNSDGLDVHNTAKTSEISLIEAGIVENERRWTITRRVIDNLYPMRNERCLKLNEKELMLIKRGCNENQTSLFNFNQRKQIGSSI